MTHDAEREAFEAWVPDHWDRSTAECAWSAWNARATVSAAAKPEPINARLLAVCKDIERWWVSDGNQAQQFGAPACIFNLRDLLAQLQRGALAAKPEGVDLAEEVQALREALAEWEGEHCGGDCLAAPCSHCDGTCRTTGKGERLQTELDEAREELAAKPATVEVPRASDLKSGMKLRVVKPQFELQQDQIVTVTDWGKTLDGSSTWLYVQEGKAAHDISRFAALAPPPKQEAALDCDNPTYQRGYSDGQAYVIQTCAKFLKEGELPHERMERDHRDSMALMRLLAAEKIKNESMSAPATAGTAQQAQEPVADNREELLGTAIRALIAGRIKCSDDLPPSQRPVHVSARRAFGAVHALMKAQEPVAHTVQVPRVLFEAWRGLCFGTDWNRGTAAKHHRHAIETMMREMAEIPGEPSSFARPPSEGVKALPPLPEPPAQPEQPEQGSSGQRATATSLTAAPEWPRLVGIAGQMPGTGGAFTMAVFKAVDVPEGHNVFAYPPNAEAAAQDATQMQRQDHPSAHQEGGINTKDEG